MTFNFEFGEFFQESFFDFLKTGKSIWFVVKENCEIFCFTFLTNVEPKICT